jgi:hypothetical protein
MSSTLDNINNNMLIRIDSLIDICEILSEYNLDSLDEINVERVSSDLAEIKQSYIMNTIGTISSYYQTEDTSLRKTLYNQFIISFHSCNIVGLIKRNHNILKRINKTYNIDHEDLQELFKKYEYANIDETYDDNAPGKCKNCKIPYDIEEKTSSFICRECGKTEKLEGIVFEDEQFFYQEGQRTKHGKYESARHCKFWVDRIQAKENTNIPSRVINAIKKCIRRDKLWIEDITCENIRDYLKQCGITNYNNHVPLILKIITGKEPPQFTEHELKLIFMYFGLVIQIFNKIKADDESNCPYHPFFIYKIVEQILKKPSETSRRKKILSCIHLQSRETLIDNDIKWFDICEYIPDFKNNKIATDSAIQ